MRGSYKEGLVVLKKYKRKIRVEMVMKELRRYT